MVRDKNIKQTPVKNMNEDNDDEIDNEAIRVARCREKLLCELDTYRRYACQEKINAMLVRVQQCSHKALRDKINQQTNVWLESQAKHLKEEQEIYLKLHEEEEKSRKRQEQLMYEHEQHSKRLNEISNSIRERERENEERRSELYLRKKILTEKCVACVMEYRKIYENFVEVLKSCKDKRLLGEKCVSQVTRLKSLSNLMNHDVPEKCKNMAVRDEDLIACSSALEEAKLIVEKMGLDIELINNDHEQARLLAKQKEEAAAAAAATAETLVSVPRSSADNVVLEGNQGSQPSKNETSNISCNSSVLKEYVNENAYKKYIQLKQFRETFAKSYDSLLKDEGMKKFRFECQKAVNTPVNAISPISVPHLQDKLTKLHKLLTGQNVESGKGYFSAAQHNQGIAFCKDLLAKKFVSQGETTVSSKPEAAFAIAAVVISLWVDFPDFGQLLLAHFYKECPYLIPFFKPRLVDQTDVNYYKSLGYHYSESGEVEKQDKFLKRMSGIMHLYCAIIVTPLKRQCNKPHPMGINEAWRWIASIVNLDPRPDICATMIYEFLEVTGYFMYQYYGQIFQKILHLLCTEYYHKMEEVTPSASRGPVARLESFLQQILKEGRIKPPTGILPNNFW